jgi:nucleotide-binding universal stress UspA family protein
MTLKNILVPTDFSDASQQAVQYGFELAAALNATLHVMHVVENPFATGAFMEMYRRRSAQSSRPGCAPS